MVETDTEKGIEKGVIIFNLLLVAGFIGIVWIVIFGVFAEEVFSTDASNSSNQTILTSSSATLTPIGSGITSLNANANNQTWLEFVPNGERINVLDNYNFSEEKTISLWFNANDMPDFDRVFSSEYSNNFGDLIYFETNKIRFQHQYGINGNKSNVGTTSTLLLNKWYNVIVKYNDTVASLYLDGFFQNTFTYNTTSNVNNNNFKLGGSSVSSSSSLNGSIMEFKLYNYTLNQSEINDVYINSKYNSDKTYVPIVYFHGVGDDDTGFEPINTTNFDSFLAHLNDTGYTTITTTQLKNYSLGEINYTKPIVLLSDDGYQDLYTEALPILQKYNAVITVGLIGDCVSNNDEHNGTILCNETTGAVEYMNWTQIISLQESGNEMAGHSMTHPHLTNSPLDGMNNSVCGNNRTCEFMDVQNLIFTETGITPTTFFQPFNDWNATTMDECNNYYEVCTATDGSQLFELSNSKLNNGEFTRLVIGDTTTLNEFTLIVDITSPLNIYINYQLNENSGTTAHDLSGNGNDGTITGATWRTDGLFVLLTEGVDYSIGATTGLFTILNSDLQWSEMIASWSYNFKERGDGYNVATLLTTGITTFFGFSVTWFTIIALVILITILISLLALAVTILKMVKGKDDGFVSE